MPTFYQTGTTVSDGIEISFKRFGNRGKVPIIIVHGLSFFSHDWIEVASELASDREVVAMDMRGFGDSQWSPSKDYGIPAMARDIDAVVMALGWSKCIVVGHSMGGRLSSYFSAEYAHKVKKLILVDYSPETAPAGTMRVAEIVGNQPDSFFSVDEAMRYFGVDPDTDVGKRKRPRYEAYLRQVDGKYQVKRDLHFRDQFKKILQTSEVPKRGIDMWDVLGRVKCQVLVLRGTKSDMFAAETVRKVREKINSLTFKEIEAGHDIAGDNPEALVSAITSFIRPKNSAIEKYSAMKNDLGLRGVDHLALVTDDMPATMDFYTRVLGMPLVHVRRVPFERDRGQPPYENLRHYFFDMGNDSLLAFFEYPKNLKQQDRDLPGGMQHLAFSVPLASFDSMIEKLKTNGVKVIGPVPLGGRFLSAYFYDNNGIRLELAANLMSDSHGNVESSLQNEDEARAELKTLFDDPELVESWLQRMPVLSAD